MGDEIANEIFIFRRIADIMIDVLKKMTQRHIESTKNKALKCEPYNVLRADDFQITKFTRATSDAVFAVRYLKLFYILNEIRLKFNCLAFSRSDVELL